MASQRVISIDELCGVLSIGRTKIYELISAGNLDVLKIGRRTLVTLESVDRLIENSRVNRPGTEGEAASVM